MLDMKDIVEPLRESASHLAEAAAAARRGAQQAITPYRRHLRAAYDDAGRYLRAKGSEIETGARALIERAQAVPRRPLRNRVALVALSVAACWIVVRRLRRKRRQQATAKATRARRPARKAARRTPAKRGSNSSSQRTPPQVH